MNHTEKTSWFEKAVCIAQSCTQLMEFAIVDGLLQPRVFRTKIGQRLRQVIHASRIDKIRRHIVSLTERRNALNFESRSQFQRLESGPGGVYFNELPNFGELMDDGRFDEAFKLARHGWQRRIAKQAMVNMQVCAVPSVPLPDRSSMARHQAPRVLFLITNSYPFTQSGYAVRTHSLLQAVQDSGVYVEAMTRFGYPAIVGKPIFRRTQIVDGIAYHRMLDWRFPLSVQKVQQRAVAAVVEHARAMGATHIHTTTDFHNAAVASAAAVQLGIPWIYEVRGEATETWVSGVEYPRDEYRNNSWRAIEARKLEASAVEAASGAVFLSEVSRQHFQSLVETMPPSVLVPNSISETDAEESRQILQQMLQAKQDETVTASVRSLRRDAARQELGGFEEFNTWVGSVSAIVDYEGFETLIESLKYLDDDVAVLLVGGGSARGRLEELARSLGVSHRVRFAGVQPFSEINKWYEALDAFVIPRRNQTVCRRVTPIKAQKAMALGVPVIASDLPALREVTGGNATYFTAGDGFRLSEAVGESKSQDIARSMRWIQGQVWKASVERLINFY